jgi:hypothetical protein
LDVKYYILRLCTIIFQDKFKYHNILRRSGMEQDLNKVGVAEWGAKEFCNIFLTHEEGRCNTGIYRNSTNH